METARHQLQTQAGLISIIASEHGLRGVFFEQQQGSVTRSTIVNSGADKILMKAVKQVKEYFAGERRGFDLPLALQGTTFQKKVWRQLAKIPYGKTVSYRDIAKAIGHPNAVRAVGNANGKNHCCIIIPCHRVIASDGTIGGYSGGVDIKRKLLKLEGCSLPEAGRVK